MKIKGPGWPDRAGWYALALFAQTLIILLMIYTNKDLRTDEFFKNIATAIIITGWIGFAVGQSKNEKERENTAKALDLAKTTTPNTTEHMDVKANSVSLEGKSK